MVLGAAVSASAQQTSGVQPNQGVVGAGQWPYMMGPGMMDPCMMGQGMMGQGMGPGAMQPLARDLETSDVERMMNSWLAWQRNPNLKLGGIEARDEYIFVVEIVTQNGSLVQRYEVNRQTGWMRPL
jgi:hypothetical protein